MPRYTLRSAAARDIEEIHGYISLELHNRPAAKRFLERFFEVCDLLTHSPRMGARRAGLDERFPDLRFVPVGSYLAFYRETASGVEIIRVLYARRLCQRG